MHLNVNNASLLIRGSRWLLATRINRRVKPVALLVFILKANTGMLCGSAETTDLHAMYNSRSAARPSLAWKMKFFRCLPS
mmetsp:Transcript_3922/g.11741  ORF Transcript_3922/g.11741 Transcript_3922/m.11741 type:complete len:80 (-) Transcript_3922:2656-2895(-)